MSYGGLDEKTEDDMGDLGGELLAGLAHMLAGAGESGEGLGGVCEFKCSNGKQHQMVR